MEDELIVGDMDIMDILDIEDDVSETLKMKNILKAKNEDVAILEDRVDEIDGAIEETETRVETIEEQVQALNSDISTLSKEIKRVEKIKPKIIEKVIEKTETIVETPIITNEIREVAVADSAQEIVNKINSLDPNKEEEKIDAKHIKNLPEFTSGRGGSRFAINGVPLGGTTGQVLKKKSNSDFDMEWGTSGGAGITDGDKGDIIVSGGGTVWELDPTGAISNYPTTTTVSGWLSEYMPYIDSLVNTVQYDTLLMSGDTDDYDTIGKGVLFINASGAYRLSGVKSMGNGAILRINNYGDSTVTLSHQDPHSSLYNQFFLPKGQNITLDTGEGCMFIWNNDVRNWMYIDTFAVKSIVAGAGISVDNTDPAAPLISATGITRIILTVSGAVAAGSNANTDYVYFCNNTTTITLPTAIGNTNQYTIKNTSTGRSVTIATTGGQLIEGALTAVLPLDPPSVDIYSDGTNRFIT